MKFKIGDKVKVVGAVGPAAEHAKWRIGARGVVEGVLQNALYPYWVEFGCPNGATGFCARELELVKPKAKAKPKKK